MDLFCDPEAQNLLKNTNQMDQITLNSTIGQSQEPEWL
jgi:hypothetical protein